MKNATLDRPWKRPGAAAYARRRRAAAMHPPVTVYAMPADVTKEEDVPVRMRDGVTLRLNLFRRPRRMARCPCCCPLTHTGRTPCPR